MKKTGKAVADSGGRAPRCAEECSHLRKLEKAIEDRVRELEKSQRRYQSLFENAASGIVISTWDGDIVAANPAFYHMLKYPEDGSERIHVFRNQLYCDIKDRWYMFHQLDNYGFVKDFEVKVRAKDGSTLMMSVSCTMFEEDGTMFCESIWNDVTERRRLEEELRQEKESLEEKVRRRTAGLQSQKDRLVALNRALNASAEELRSTISRIQTLFNAITEHVISMDRDFVVLMTNRSPEDVGKKCYKAIFGKDAPCRRCPAVRAVASKKPASIEIAMGEGTYQLQCYPILDKNGEIEGVIEWAKDITREKSLCDQMLQADRLACLGQLVSGIGHEINNPNTFILGNMKIIHEAFMDILPILDEYYDKRPDVKIARLDYSFFKDHVELLLEDMVGGSERIRTIVQDLKKFARGSESRMDDEVSLNLVVQRSVRLVQNQVKRKANIFASLDETIPPMRANGMGIEQVLVNLIINASDAIPGDEKGNIRISTAMDVQRSQVVVTVGDDGAGMNDETKRQIFNPFFTTKRSRGGTGLGLSIAYRIIKEHDGEIEVESSPGKGTTFRIELPVAQRSVP